MRHFPVPDADHLGELQAWNLSTGEEVWTQEFESHNWGPVLTTGGGWCFPGAPTTEPFGRLTRRPAKSSGSSGPTLV